MDIALSGYIESLEYLFARTTGTFRFGLERTRALLAELDDPHLAYPIIHIAGTNGKGSAVATADALLQDKGLRVAKYTSPHLVDFRERIVVGGAPIEGEAVVRFIEEHTPLIERIGASFFEATTALALLHFASQHADVALVETGLGGRLDSTNVVVPRSSGVTSIGYDHMEYLGPTLEDIAREKAGVFKRGLPAVIGETDPEVRAWLARDAHAAGATPVRVTAEEMRIENVTVSGHGTRFHLSAFGDRLEVETPLIGHHQAANFAFTLALLDAAGERYRVSLRDAARAVAGVRLPGRFHRVNKWIFDVAHNPDGARTLAASLASVEHDEPVVALLCVLDDKDWRAMIDALAPGIHLMVLTDAPTAPRSRAWVLDAALEYAKDRGHLAVAVPDFDDAIRRADAEGATILVTGSFHTVGDAMARLQVSPLSG